MKAYSQIEIENTPFVEELGARNIITLGAAIFVVVCTPICAPFFVLYSLYWVVKNRTV